MESQKGFCQCGCGQKTKLSKQNDSRDGYAKGEPRQYMPGHYIRVHPPNFNNGISYNHPDGYVRIKAQHHLNADGHGYVFEHVLVASKALGRALPPKAHVHHINGVTDDNRPSNLVICENSGYHSLLHIRAKALKEAGDPNLRRCVLCKNWDNPLNLHHGEKNRTYRHKKCNTDYHRIRRQRIRAQDLLLPGYL